MNISILKMVVGIIGLLLVMMAAGVILLLMQGKNVPSEFWTIIVSGFTGLLGLLAPSKEVARPSDEGGA
jgi:hypothetical protein